MVLRGLSSSTFASPSAKDDRDGNILSEAEMNLKFIFSIHKVVKFLMFEKEVRIQNQNLK